MGADQEILWRYINATFEKGEDIATALTEAGYVIMPKIAADDMLKRCDAALMALPQAERRVDGPERFGLLRFIYCFFIASTLDQS